MVSAVMSPSRSPAQDQKDMKDELHVKSTMRALPINVLFQVCSRILTFVMNAILLRYVTRDALGIMNVRLILIYSSSQFMSREPFRRTISDAGDFAFAFMSIPVSLIYGTIFYQIWTRLLVIPEEFDSYDSACFLMVSSVVIEMIAEPFFILSQKEGKFFLRIFGEGVSLIVRSVCLFCFVMSSNDDEDSKKTILIAFSSGQVLGSIAYTTCFLFSYFTRISEVNDSFLSSVNKTELLSVTFTFTGQTIVKQLLTEGERFLMTFFNAISFADQGVYDVVNNLASLAARFILAPVEESSYLMFSSLIDRSKEMDKQDRTRMKRAFDLLCNLVKVMTIVGLVIFTFGFSFSELALTLYASRSFAEGVASCLLRWQSFYILIISVNGITEAFALASMTESRLKSFNVILVFLSIVFIISSYFLTSFLGSLGFILANSLNMFGRIVHSFHFIHTHRKAASASEQKFSLTDMLPQKFIIASFAVIFLFLKISETILCCSSFLASLFHVVLGATALIFVLVIVYIRERSLVQFLKEYFKISERN